MYGSVIELEQYIKKYNVDINFEHGYYIEIICMRNNLELLKLMLKYGGDINANDEYIVKYVAHEGFIELLDYIFNNYDVDIDKLFRTTACSNNKLTVEYLKNKRT
jgi:ankyrin repeat protein